MVRASALTASEKDSLLPAECLAHDLRDHVLLDHPVDSLRSRAGGEQRDILAPMGFGAERDQRLLLRLRARLRLAALSLNRARAVGVAER